MNYSPKYLNCFIIIWGFQNMFWYKLTQDLFFFSFVAQTSLLNGKAIITIKTLDFARLFGKLTMLSIRTEKSEFFTSSQSDFRLRKQRDPHQPWVKNAWTVDESCSFILFINDEMKCKESWNSSVKLDSIFILKLHPYWSSDLNKWNVVRTDVMPLPSLKSDFRGKVKAA